MRKKNSLNLLSKNRKITQEITEGGGGGSTGCILRGKSPMRCYCCLGHEGSLMINNGAICMSVCFGKVLPLSDTAEIMIAVLETHKNKQDMSRNR